MTNSIYTRFAGLIFLLILIVAGLPIHSFAMDPSTLCSQESEKRLMKLEQKGEPRFSEIKFSDKEVQVSDADFADFAGVSKRGRRKHKEVGPAKPQMGHMLTAKVLGKEKNGWRNLIVRCGVNKGKLSTFTYEILNLDMPTTASNSENQNH